MKWSYVCIAFAAGIFIGTLLSGRSIRMAPEYEILTVRDTVIVAHPVPVAVPETVRVVTERFQSPFNDSVTALVPVTSVLYTGPGYRARVSGFRPRLDSLVFEKSTMTYTPAPRTRRWAVGIQAGAAMTPKGIQPFIGIGVTYKLYEF